MEQAYKQQKKSSPFCRGSGDDHLQMHKKCKRVIIAYLPGGMFPFDRPPPPPPSRNDGTSWQAKKEERKVPTFLQGERG